MKTGTGKLSFEDLGSQTPFQEEWKNRVTRKQDRHLGNSQQVPRGGVFAKKIMTNSDESTTGARDESSAKTSWSAEGKSGTLKTMIRKTKGISAPQGQVYVRYKANAHAQTRWPTHELDSGEESNHENWKQ